MIVAALILSGALYAVGVRSAARWPWWRAAAFGLGLITLGVALASPVHDRGEEQLSAHMVQHLLLTIVAAPLLVAGAPVALALRALHGSARRELGALVTSRVARAVTRPLAGWVAFAAVTVGTHLTGLYDLALRDPFVHVVEHGLYVGSALLLWTSLMGVHPGEAGLGAIGRLAWLMATMPAMAGVGAWLSTSDVVRYDAYAGQVGALADQQEAGAIMWALGTLPMALLAFALAGEALWREERRQRRREAIEEARA